MVCHTGLLTACSQAVKKNKFEKLVHLVGFIIRIERYLVCLILKFMKSEGYQPCISLRRADHSSRGVLPTVVRRCV